MDSAPNLNDFNYRAKIKLEDGIDQEVQASDKTIFSTSRTPPHDSSNSLRIENHAHTQAFIRNNQMDIAHDLIDLKPDLSSFGINSLSQQQPSCSSSRYQNYELATSTHLNPIPGPSVAEPSNLPLSSGNSTISQPMNTDIGLGISRNENSYQQEKPVDTTTPENHRLRELNRLRELSNTAARRYQENVKQRRIARDRAIHQYRADIIQLINVQEQQMRNSAALKQLIEANLPKHLAKQPQGGAEEELLRRAKIVLKELGG